MNQQDIAVAAATVLAPYAPYLVSLAKKGSEKLAETIAEKGGEAAWKQAQALWARIKGQDIDTPRLDAAITLLSEEPSDQEEFTILTKAIVAQMERDPDLAGAILSMLGGKDAVLKVVASSGSSIKNVYQETFGGSSQIVEASGGSTVDGVVQRSRAASAKED